jgi:hypothetical protein
MAMLNNQRVINLNTKTIGFTVLQDEMIKTQLADHPFCVKCLPRGMADISAVDSSAHFRSTKPTDRTHQIGIRRGDYFVEHMAGPFSG